MALTSIYTKSGDTGRASTLTRQHIPKDSPIFQLLGSLDEVSSFLGLARAKAPALDDVLQQLQNSLMAVSGELAGGKRFVDQTQVKLLERAIDTAAESTGGFEGFVLPGETEGGAALDVARTVARRAERWAVTASQTGGITRDMLAWLNRLSDLLFTLARLCDRAGTVPASAPAATTATMASASPGFCDRAMHLCKAVRDHAAAHDVKVVTAVSDAGGNPVAMLRADDAFIASVDIATNKAFTAVSLKMTTEELGRLAQPGQSLYGIQFTNNGRMVIFGGGVPLVENGVIVGGFGVSGGTAEQDTAFGNFAKDFYEKELI